MAEEIADRRSDSGAHDGVHGVPHGVDVGDLVGDHLNGEEDAGADEHVGASQGVGDLPDTEDAVGQSEDEHDEVGVDAAAPPGAERHGDELRSHGPSLLSRAVDTSWSPDPAVVATGCTTWCRTGLTVPHRRGRRNRARVTGMPSDVATHAERARSASGRDPCAPPFADRTRTGKPAESARRPPEHGYSPWSSRWPEWRPAGARVSAWTGTHAEGLEGVEGVLTRCRRQGLESRYRTPVRTNAVDQQIGHQVSVVGWCRTARVGREWFWVVMSGLDVSEGDVSWCVGSVIPSRCGSVVWVTGGCVEDVVGRRARSRPLPPRDEGAGGIAARALC